MDQTRDFLRNVLYTTLQLHTRIDILMLPELNEKTSM